MSEEDYLARARVGWDSDLPTFHFRDPPRNRVLYEDELVFGLWDSALSLHFCLVFGYYVDTRRVST